jgi:hypothetical protein
MQELKMTYYKEIDGKKYDGKMLEVCEASVAGQGDGRISLDDAQKVFDAIKDNNTYTDIEQDTMRYIRDNFKFTDQADGWLRKEVKLWNLEGHG